MEILKKLETIIIAHSDDFGYSGSKDSSLIELAEKELDVKLSNSYKTFLKAWGVLWFNAKEYYGVINPETMNRGIPDVVWFNKHIRAKYEFLKHLIVFFENDNEYYCMDTSRIDESGECPIIQWDKNLGEITNEINMTFLEFLLEDVEDSLDE